MNLIHQRVLALMIGLMFLWAIDLSAQPVLPENFQVWRMHTNVAGKRVVVFSGGSSAVEGRTFMYSHENWIGGIKLLSVGDDEVKLEVEDKVMTIPRVKTSVPIIEPLEIVTDVIGTNAASVVKVKGLHWEGDEEHTALMLQVELAEGEILGLDKGILSQWRDDRGTVLATKPAHGGWLEKEVIKGIDIEKDAYLGDSKFLATNILVQSVRVNKKASSVARRMKLTGDLTLYHGMERQKGTLPVFTLVKGAKFKVGDFEFLIDKKSDSQMGIITVLPAEYPLSFLRQLRFYDAAGNEIPATISNRSGLIDIITQLMLVRLEVVFKEPVTTAGIKYDIYSKIINRSVPVSVEVRKK